MSALSGLLLSLAISALLGALLYFAIRGPLQAMLLKSCAQDQTVAFWSRFTMIMLFLAPAFLSLVAGLPPSDLIAKTDPAALVVRLSTASIVGGFLAMLGMGLWVASLANRFAQAASFK
jgi:hypothetical protein